MSLSEELHRLAELRERGVLSPEEFERAKAKLLDAQPAGQPSEIAAINSLRRSRTDRWIGGVCGGLAKMIGVESWILRLCLALMLFFWGIGGLLYILLWIFVPEEE